MRRAVRNLIRLIAAGLIIFGMLQVGLELVRHRMKQLEIRVSQCVIGSVLILAGAALAAGSAPLAEQLTDDDEGDENPPDLDLPPRNL